MPNLLKIRRRKNPSSQISLTHTPAGSLEIGPVYPISFIPVVPGDDISIDIAGALETLALKAPVFQDVDVLVELFFAPTRNYVKSLRNNSTNFNPADAPLPNITPPLYPTDVDTNDDSRMSFLENVVQPNSLAQFCGFPVGFCNPFSSNDSYKGDYRFGVEYALAYLDVIRNYYVSGQTGYISNAHFASVTGGTTSDLAYVQGTTAVSVLDSYVESMYNSTTGAVSFPWLNFVTRGSMIYCRTQEPTRLEVWLNKSRYDNSAGRVRVSTDADGNIFLTDIRSGSHVLKFKELLNVGSRRYDDYKIAQFDVHVPNDQNIPVFLGRSKGSLGIGTVVQNTPTSDSPLGAQAGRGTGGLRLTRRRFRFSDYGTLVVNLSLRPRNVYYTGCDPHILKLTMQDKLIPTLDNMSLQSLRECELNFVPSFLAETDTSSKFIRPYKPTSNELDPLTRSMGYQPMYSEYTSLENRLYGKLSTSLRYWSFARHYNNSFVSPASNGLLAKAISQIETQHFDKPGSEVISEVVSTVWNNYLGTPALVTAQYSPYINPLLYKFAFDATGPTDENIFYNVGIGCSVRREKSKINVASFAV